MHSAQTQQGRIHDRPHVLPHLGLIRDPSNVERRFKNSNRGEQLKQLLSQQPPCFGNGNAHISTPLASQNSQVQIKCVGEIYDVLFFEHS